MPENYNFVVLQKAESSAAISSSYFISTEQLSVLATWSHISVAACMAKFSCIVLFVNITEGKQRADGRGEPCAGVYHASLSP